MKRRYKLGIIILLGIVITIFINNLDKQSKDSLVALGDGLSIGMTSYNVVGTSFNDYLIDKLKIDNYNIEFSYVNETIHELNEHITNNTQGKYSKIPIKQLIDKASIITIAIGLDELASKSLTEEITLDIIDNYIKEVDILLSSIRSFYDNNIIVIGLYPAYNLLKKDVIDINFKLKTICGKYNTSFLDILPYYLHKEYFNKESSYYMNYLAHQQMANEIYTYIKND